MPRFHGQALMPLSIVKGFFRSAFLGRSKKTASQVTKNRAWCMRHPGACTLLYCVEPPSPMRLSDERCAAVASSTIIDLDLAVAGILLGHILYNLRCSCNWFLRLRAFWGSLTPPSADAEHAKNPTQVFFGPDYRVESTDWLVRESFDKSYALRGETTESRMTNRLTRM